MGRFTLAEMFEQKYIPEPNSGCFLWIAAFGRDGYGLVRRSNPRRMQAAHRFAFELANGSIPDDLQIDHLCRVTSCVNPRHMEVVTTQENSHRRIYSPVCLKCGGPFIQRKSEGSFSRRCRPCDTKAERKRRDSHRTLA